MNITTPTKIRLLHRRAVIAAASMAIVAMTIAARAEAQVTPPPVPANLEVEKGNTPFLVGHAVGTQNYICLLAPKGFAWTFFGPQATLFGDDGQQITTHFLSANPDENGTLRPTW